MAQKFISVQAYEAELTENENDHKFLMWSQLMATLAGAGGGMKDFSGRVRRLQNANDEALPAALSTEAFFSPALSHRHRQFFYTSSTVRYYTGTGTRYLYE